MLLQKSVTTEAMDMIVTSTKKKTYDGHLNEGEWKNMCVGDVIIYKHARREIVCRIMQIIPFPSFLEMYRTLEDIIPYVDKGEKEGSYQGFFPAQNEQVLAFEIQLVLDLF